MSAKDIFQTSRQWLLIRKLLITVLDHRWRRPCSALSCRALGSTYPKQTFSLGKEFLGYTLLRNISERGSFITKYFIDT